MIQRECIECFHLLFASRLAAKVDRNFFSLKGGCNLRFYFQSIRYSEDIDFDVHTTSLQTLKKNVEKILEDKNFNMLLLHEKIEILEWSSPKQTATTQRWKITLKAADQSMNIPTKIEFSRRDSLSRHTAVEFVNPSLISRYQLQPVLLQHYSLNAAIEQKLGALIHRTETQARDILDLKILKDQLSGRESFGVSKKDIEKAIETLMSVSFDHFKSQVWPYLLSEFQGHYKQRAAWDLLQNEVLSFVQGQLLKK